MHMLLLLVFSSEKKLVQLDRETVEPWKEYTLTNCIDYWFEV